MLNFWPVYIHEVWRNRLGDCKRVALFGAGEHSRWLLETLTESSCPTVVMLIDDEAERIREIRGRPVVKPERADLAAIDAVVISSDAHEDLLYQRATRCCPDARLVRLYEGLPPGPYEKQGDYSVNIYSTAAPGETVNLDTVVATAQTVETKKRLMDVFSLLDPDPFFKMLSDGYRRGIERFGSQWKYADLWSMLYAFARVARPRRYLEIGTRRGHSLAAVCSGAMDGGQSEFEIVSCDLWTKNYAGLDNPGPEFVTQQMSRLGYQRPIHFLNGSSHVVLPEFLRSEHQTFDLITVDGDHSHDGAAADLALVSGSLRVGGMMAFDDLNHPQHPRLHEVWQASMSNRPHWETYANLRDGTGTAAAIRFR